MKSDAQVNSRVDVKDLLLEEYRALTTSLEKSEATGETRFNWFIGVVTAVAGGLVALIANDKLRLPEGTPKLLEVVSKFTEVER